MNGTIRKTWMLFVFVLSVIQLKAQVSTYERVPGYWTFGINGGLAYQQSDINPTLDGFGVGLTLGKNLYYQPGSIFSFDGRGRFLYSRTYGLDTRRSFGIENNDALNGTIGPDYTTEGGGPGFSFLNNRTDHAELAVEGVLNFNRLRERTNVILSIFGGIGLDWYNTKTDQLDDFGQIYDFSSIPANSSVSFTKDQLRNSILDGSYETDAHGFDDQVGRLGIMPALGVELGYQLTPRFSVGVGHKMTFTNTDIYDGHQWKDNGDLTGDNDIHHYTNLHLRWIIEPAEERLRPPVIDVRRPAISPHTTTIANQVIEADIKHINSSMDVDFTVNGYRETFNYRKGRFTSQIRLRPGQNEAVITATNSEGSDQETIIIYYEEPVIDNPPTIGFPTVDITNPPYDDYRVSDERFMVLAQLSNVQDSRDIQFSVNGYDYDNFFYDTNRGTFESGINLREGRNEVRITVRNPRGSDTDQATIILERQQDILPPFVRFTTPTSDPYYTAANRVNIEAEVQNIQDKNDLTMIVNGNSTRDFSYSNGRVYMDLSLYQDQTEVIITATNPAGQDNDDLLIIREDDQPVEQAPVVNITSSSQPTIDPFDPTNCRSTVIATVLNVTSANNIQLTLNGSSFYDFNFDPGTQVLRTTVPLQQGFNELIIEAFNNAGSDSDRVTMEGCSNGQQNDPPVVTITTPAQPSTTQPSPQANIVATVLNVDSGNDITFFVNGNSTNNFDFNASTNVFSASISLQEGWNEVRVEARNAEGQDSDAVSIRFEKPIIGVEEPPIVDILEPANNSGFTQPNITLVARVQNVSSKSQIELFVNGQSTNNFSFDAGREEINASITLSPNSNVLRVKATNNDGTDEESVQVRFNPPAPKPPTVEFTKPLPEVTTTTSNKASIEAVVKNVSEKRDLTLTQNGRRINNFSFNNGIVLATLSLEPGKNTVILQARNDDGNAQDQRVINYNRPAKPPKVTISTPKDNAILAKDKTEVKATIQNVELKNDIQVLINGRSISFSYRNGTLTTDARLREGSNTILVKAQNADGEAQDQHTVRYERPKNPPTVDITTPKDGATVRTNKTTVKAKIERVQRQNDIQLLVNNRKQNFTFFNGQLSAQINLKEGKNIIQVKAKNADGEAQDKVTVRYERPKKLPAVNISTPKDGLTVKQAKNTVKASIQNVERQSDIQLLINGKAQTFTFFNGQLNAQVTLKYGNNTILVKAKNADGEAQDQHQVKYPRPKTPPQVRITTPKNNAKLKTAKTQVVATVKNVTKKSELQLLVNGKKQNFSYGDGKLTATVNLKPKTNTIVVKANNRDGSDEAQVKVTYTPPQPKPVVKFTNPRRGGATVKKAAYTVKATVQNVTDKKNVIFQMNGKSVKNFSFNASSGAISANVQLKSGKNTFEIKASNSAGSVKANTDISLKLPVIEETRPPSVKISSVSTPTVDPFNPDQAKSTIIAKLSNVASEREITFTVNGNKVTNYNFDPASGSFNITITLQRGDNTCILKVNNRNGSDKVSRVITFE